MDTITMYAMGVSALIFIAAGIYLHFLRKKGEAVMPAPFLPPAGKRYRKGKSKKR